jgi:hypothetical protein
MQKVVEAQDTPLSRLKEAPLAKGVDWSLHAGGGGGGGGGADSRSANVSCDPLR